MNGLVFKCKCYDNVHDTLSLIIVVIIVSSIANFMISETVLVIK